MIPRSTYTEVSLGRQSINPLQSFQCNHFDDESRFDAPTRGVSIPGPSASSRPGTDFRLPGTTIEVRHADALEVPRKSIGSSSTLQGGMAIQCGRFGAQQLSAEVSTEKTLIKTPHHPLDLCLPTKVPQP